MSEIKEKIVYTYDGKIFKTKEEAEVYKEKILWIKKQKRSCVLARINRAKDYNLPRFHMDYITLKKQVKELLKVKNLLKSTKTVLKLSKLLDKYGVVKGNLSAEIAQYAADRKWLKESSEIK